MCVCSLFINHHIQRDWVVAQHTGAYSLTQRSHEVHSDGLMETCWNRTNSGILQAFQILKKLSINEIKFFRSLHAIVIYPALNLNIKEFIFEVLKAFKRHDVSKKIADIPDPICFQTNDVETRRRLHSPESLVAKKYMSRTNDERFMRIQHSEKNKYEYE